MSGRVKLPSLPDGQRWLLEDVSLGFMRLSLQERRPRRILKGVKWVTVADCTEFKSGGTDAVWWCVEYIQRRGEIARTTAELAARRKQDAARIPWGESA